MDATVTRLFKCKVNGRVYHPGESYAGEAERLAQLEGLGFVRTPAGQAPAGAEAAAGEEQAPDVADLESMTVKELAALCEDNGIEVPSRPRKDALVAALSLYFAESAAEAGEE